MVGADPSFTDVHLLRALLILHTGVMGRKRLVKRLGVGEGSVRTIIKRLTYSGYLDSSKLGHSLTKKGASEAESKLKKMSKPAAFDSEGLVDGYQSLIVLYGAADKIGGEVALRDCALKAGADGAVILVKQGGLRFPGGGLELDNYPPAKEKLEKSGLAEGDAAVIGFSKNSYAKAEDGAVAVTLEILPKQ